MTGQGDKNINMIKCTIIHNVSGPTMKCNLKQQGINYVTTRSLWLSVLCAGKQAVRVWERPGRRVHTHLIISQTRFGGHVVWRICLLPCWLCALPQKWDPASLRLIGWLAKYILMDTTVRLMMSDLVCLWLWLFVIAVIGADQKEKPGGICLLQTSGFTWRTS